MIMNYGTSSLMGAGQQACKVAEASQIDQRLAELDKANEELRSIVAGFQVRLGAVLTPQMKGESANGAATPKPIVSPLADRLDSVLNEHRQSCYLLRDMFDMFDRLAI
jgi:hypothetical protein